MINAQHKKTQVQRQWRISRPSDFDILTLKKYIADAKRIADAGTTPPPKKLQPHSIPTELASALQSDPRPSAAFKKLSGSCQREYCEYINEAKPLTTRVHRIEKITPLILNGPGFSVMTIVARLSLMASGSDGITALIGLVAFPSGKPGKGPQKPFLLVSI